MKRIENARLLYLDQGPVERLLEFHADYYPVVSAVLDLVYGKNIQMVGSPVTLHSICTRAFSKGNAVLAREYREFFTRSRHLVLRDVDAEIALSAAEFRAKHRLGVEESLSLATAFVTGADVVFTEHESWKNYLDSEVITLDDLRNE